MGDTVSLQHLIEEVLQDFYADKNTAADPSNVRNLRRAFERFIEALGGDPAILKDDSGRYKFEQDEVRYVKFILAQLNRKHEVFDILIKDHQRKKAFSSEKVNDLIKTLFAEAEQNQESCEELEELAKLCCKVFLFSPMRSLEKCHAAIDALWSTVQDLTYDEQSAYLANVAKYLELEIRHSIVESAINISDTARLAVYFTPDGFSPYEDLPSDIQYDYLQRDRNILARIQQDEGLRYYIESTFNKKAEDIFGYTAI